MWRNRTQDSEITRKPHHNQPTMTKTNQMGEKPKKQQAQAEKNKKNSYAQICSNALKYTQMLKICHNDRRLATRFIRPILDKPIFQRFACFQFLSVLNTFTQICCVLLFFWFTLVRFGSFGCFGERWLVLDECSECLRFFVFLQKGAVQECDPRSSP